ncbi:hypothetical protein [Lacimicrobium alkaliphilum]|uniref:Lipoprotein n=1 Tax=Lacimicrobium alkaliphilum TaxID=1526571 RepID=A0A0U2ZAZ6_9ALTE|nr:hypothetical protein [Lacimicrobium alkaliphilum]ALT00100.1 hypothetical protein AT746_18720 [Lacimicrobium alkaliphilum]
MQKLLISLMIGGAALMAGCASNPDSKYASIEHLSDTERNQALKECFKSDLNKDERQDCLARYAPAEVGYRCERRQVTGTRFGERVCTTERQREAERKHAMEAMSRVSKNASRLAGPEGG